VCNEFFLSVTHLCRKKERKKEKERKRKKERKERSVNELNEERPYSIWD
jgi:hypothetical protein